MVYWEKTPPCESNLRLFVPGEGWKAHANKSEGSLSELGCADLIDSAFLNALNATNLILLTGAGSSLGTKNTATGKAAPGMADLWTAVGDRVSQAWLQETCGQFGKVCIDNDIERLLTLCKFYLELQGGPDDETTKKMELFVSEAEQAILEHVRFVDEKIELPAHLSLVQKLGRRGIRKARTKVFTTNYDLCFEEAARRLKFVTIDGFSHSLKQTYDRSHFDYDVVRRRGGDEPTDYIENVFHLYKLHGSVDWRRVDSEIWRTCDAVGHPVLIYPRSSKYQEAFETPYLDFMGIFQAAIREPDTALIVSGFGFNDDHISRPILSAVEANMSLRLIVCDPCFIEQASLGSDTVAHVLEGKELSNPFLRKFLDLAKAKDPRLHLINGRFADLAAALPDLVGETDRERHSKRIRDLRNRSGG